MIHYSLGIPYFDDILYQKILFKFIFKTLLLVITKDIISCCKKPLNLRVMLGNEFNDERITDFTQKIGDLLSTMLRFSKPYLEVGYAQSSQRICRELGKSWRVYYSHLKQYDYFYQRR